jgi:hypothetical protein
MKTNWMEAEQEAWERLYSAGDALQKLLNKRSPAAFQLASEVAELAARYDPPPKASGEGTSR